MTVTNYESAYSLKKISPKKGPQLFIYHNVDSTNLEAERYCKSLNKENVTPLNDGIVFLADEQTNGQGSFYKNWESRKGGLYYSLLITCQKGDINSSQKYAQGVGTIAKSVISRVSHQDVSLQLPNDLIVGYKKIGGILLKALIVQDMPAFIIGIGVNLNQVTFPNELEHSATSLRLLRGESINKEVLVKELTQELVHAFKEDSW
jgi:BirA family transcriptional regulator, biotin operon repressor / biotin---[acetyl-CoA-carboxylase] ligase